MFWMYEMTSGGPRIKELPVSISADSEILLDDNCDRGSFTPSRNTSSTGISQAMGYALGEGGLTAWCATLRGGTYLERSVLCQAVLLERIFTHRNPRQALVLDPRWQPTYREHAFVPPDLDCVSL